MTGYGNRKSCTVSAGGGPSDLQFTYRDDLDFRCPGYSMPYVYCLYRRTDCPVTAPQAAGRSQERKQATVAAAVAAAVATATAPKSTIASQLDSLMFDVSVTCRPPLWVTCPHLPPRGPITSLRIPYTLSVCVTT